MDELMSNLFNISNGHTWDKT